jgi:AcrR family transcriptional regulator
MPDSKSTDSKSAYHHGDLRHALIEAAEAILLERGVEGFSLREAARRAGVSPGAPAHHFGDARGLLTAVATLGFENLGAVLEAANAETARTENKAQDRRRRIAAQGRAYVRFALAQPARFDLMWRRELLDQADPAYAAAGMQAFQLLHVAVTGAPLSFECIDPMQPPDVDPRVIAAWSIVHGFAQLARQGAFDAETPGLLDGVLASLDV